MVKQREQFNLSMSDPTAFWKLQAEMVQWITAPKTIFRYDPRSLPSPHYEWFPDGTLNVCYNCIDVHLKDHGGEVALIYDSPITKPRPSSRTTISTSK
jgi:propionyl-CoA synthetase